jgi:hypothetical protein
MNQLSTAWFIVAYDSWTEHMVTLMSALLQLSVKTVPQSGKFMLTGTVLPILLVGTHCSDERRMDMLLTRPMEHV